MTKRSRSLNPGRVQMDITLRPAGHHDATREEKSCEFQLKSNRIGTERSRTKKNMNFERTTPSPTWIHHQPLRFNHEHTWIFLLINKQMTSDGTTPHTADQEGSVTMRSARGSRTPPGATVPAGWWRRWWDIPAIGDGRKGHAGGKEQGATPNVRERGSADADTDAAAAAC